MAHSDFLIFINIICWVFLFFFLYYFIFSVSLLPNLFKKIRIRTFLSHILKSIVFSFIKFYKFYGIIYHTVSIFTYPRVFKSWVMTFFNKQSIKNIITKSSRKYTPEYICFFQ